MTSHIATNITAGIEQAHIYSEITGCKIMLLVLKMDKETVKYHLPQSSLRLFTDENHYSRVWWPQPYQTQLRVKSDS